MEDSQKDDFTLKNYERCLDLSLSKGYRFYKISQIEEAEHNEMSILSRHDVDTQLDVAVEMSEIERSKDISSTFYIRLHSHSYNTFCLKDLRKVLKILENGHEIGLHYESDFYSLFKKSEVDEVKREIDILENLIGGSVTTVCPHEPTRTNSFYIKGLSSKIHQAYDPKFFKNFKYISDSSCRWRDGSFYENVISEKFKKLYILTHPYWWYHVSPIENY